MVMWLILYLNTSYVTVKLPSKSSNVSSSSNLNTSYVTVKHIDAANKNYDEIFKYILCYG